ncbi:unnamed protein product, partial [Closterium sp. NIES-64]
MAGSVGRERALEATAESAQLVAQPNPEYAPPRSQVQARPAASAPVRRLERGLSLPLRGADRHASPEQSRAPLVVASNALPARQERGRSPPPRGYRPASPARRAPEPHDSRRRWDEYQQEIQHCDRRYRSSERSPEKRSPRERSPPQRTPRPSPPRRGRGAHAGRWDSRRREQSPPRPQSAGSGGRRGRRNGYARGGGSRGQGSTADRAGNMVADAVREVEASGAAAHVHVSVTTEPPTAPVAVEAAPLRAPTLREYLPAAASRGPFRGPRQAPGYPAPQNTVGQTPGQVAMFLPRGVPTAPLPSRAGRDPTLSMCRMWNLAGAAEGLASLQLAACEAMRHTPSSFAQGTQGQCVAWAGEIVPLLSPVSDAPAGVAPLARTFPRLALDLHAAAQHGTPVDTLRFSAELLHSMAGCLLAMLEAEGAGLSHQRKPSRSRSLCPFHRHRTPFPPSLTFLLPVTPEEAQSFEVTVTLSSPSNAFPPVTRAFNISFCSAGEFLNTSSLTCDDCLVGHWCEAGQPMQPCPDGFFSFYPRATSPSQCTPCTDDNLDCTYGILTVGYQSWLDLQSLNNTPTTYSCLVADGCAGYEYNEQWGQTTAQGVMVQCQQGYDESIPTCAGCVDGYFLVLQQCTQCSSTLTRVFPLLLILVILAWMGMNILADTFSSMDIFLNDLQLLVMIASFNLNYPDRWVQTLVKIYNFAVFDPDAIGPQCIFNYTYVTPSARSAYSTTPSSPEFHLPTSLLTFPASQHPSPPHSPTRQQDAIGPQCIFNYTFISKFYLGIFIPVIGLFVYALLYARHRWWGGTTWMHIYSWTRGPNPQARLMRSVTRRRAYNEYENSIVHASLKWLDLCYVSVMVRVLSVYKSMTVGDAVLMAAAPQIAWFSSAHIGMFTSMTVGDAVLMAAAPQIAWFSSAHIGMFTVSLLVSIVYLLGLPLFFAVLLLDAHASDALSSNLFRQRFGWLTERYKRDFWWWHLVTMVLRLVHALVLVFLQQDTRAQIVIILLLQALRIGSQYKSSPLASLSLDYLQAFLSLGHFFFTLGLLCFNYIKLPAFSQAVFALSSLLILAPAAFSLVFEAINKDLEIVNRQLLNRVWKGERRRNKAKYDKMDPYDLVPPQEISAWFRPHVVFPLLLAKRAHERKLLLKVRDRVQT